MQITNAILTAQNAMLREHIGILNDTVRALETVVARMRVQSGEIPFPTNSPNDGTRWNVSDTDEIDGDDDGDTYGFGGSEWIDPTNGRDTWHG